MHVVMVVPGGVDRGGVERVIPALLWLIERVARQHRLTVVALGQEPRASVYSLLGATVVNIPPERRGPQRLARMIARGVRAAGSQGRPDVVHGMWAGISGLIAVAAARRHRVPSVVHVAGGELVALADIGYGGGLGRGSRLITATCLRSANHVTTATDWMAEHVRASGHRVDTVVPLGVDTERFALGTETPVPRRLVHVASLNGVKDQTTLLRAVAIARREIADLSIDIVGVDTLDGAVHRLACRLGIDDATRFLDYVPSAELPAVYRRAELHVLSSRHDAGPVAVLEASACGIATVGTAVGHVADFARSSPPAAIAVAVGDAELLAGSIVRLLGDEAARRALSQRALAFARANDADATATRFIELYTTLMRRSAT